jgi:UDP-3-O-[3-hydroxymyristoyl] glucosamine N-acyltransferase
MQLTAGEICNIVNGELVGDPSVIIHGPSKIEEAKSGTISFLANQKYEKYIYESDVSALLVPREFEPKQKVNATLIKVKDVYAAVGTLLAQFENSEILNGISELSFISDQAQVDKSVSLDAFCFVSQGAVIGENTQLYPQVFIGQNVKIGKNCLLYPGVKIHKDCIIGDNCILHANVVIGSDGFGYSRDSDGAYKKITHVGNVILKDKVEIGANTTIDRAVMGSTVIHEGVKLDNLIHIAHNVEIGEHAAMAAQSGIAGSGKIGAFCQIGGQVGIVGHIEIPEGTMIQAQSGVMNAGKKPGGKLFGSPAIEYNNYLKSYAIFKQLPELLKEIRELKKKLKDLDNQ